MEVMEDGNLMDKVHILIQRDMEYYKVKITCVGTNVGTYIPKYILRLHTHSKFLVNNIHISLLW